MVRPAATQTEQIFCRRCWLCSSAAFRSTGVDIAARPGVGGSLRL
jgi:hypothetical protein